MLKDLLPIKENKTFEQLIPRLNDLFFLVTGFDPENPDEDPGLTIEELREELLALLGAYDIGGQFDGQPASLARFYSPVVRKFILPANAAGSRFRAGVAPAGVAVFKIYKNAALVGTAYFAPGVPTAILATVSAAAVEFDPGNEDELTVEAPDVPDATLAHVRFTFKTEREL